MSLNTISLPAHLVAELYQNVLVQNDAVVARGAVPAAFLGNNEKNILILVNKKDAPFLPDKELNFLTTVLSACQLGLSHIAIVNHEKLQGKKLGDLTEQFNPKEVLFLDVMPQAFGLPAGDLYSVIDAGSFRFVAAPSLSEIEKTKQTKSQLWLALKQLFCL